MNPAGLPELSKPKFSGSNRRKTSNLEISISRTFLKKSLDLIFSSPAGFARIPGSEPIHLDLEKLFLLSVSKENLDFRSKIEKNEGQYKIATIYKLQNAKVVYLGINKRSHSYNK